MKFAVTERQALALAQLPAILDSTPAFLTDPAAAAALADFALQNYGITTWVLDQAIAEYKANKAAPPAPEPAPAPEVTIDYLKSIDHTGCLGGVLAADTHGNIARNILADKTGTLVALLLAMELDRVPTLKAALALDQNQPLTDMLIADPTARGGLEVFNLLEANDVAPTSMPSPERIEHFRYMSGLKPLPPSWTIKGLQIFDAAGNPTYS